MKRARLAHNITRLFRNWRAPKASAPRIWVTHDAREKSASIQQRRDARHTKRARKEKQRDHKRTSSGWLAFSPCAVFVYRRRCRHRFYFSFLVFLYNLFKKLRSTIHCEFAVTLAGVTCRSPQLSLFLCKTFFSKIKLFKKTHTVIFTVH